MYSDERFDFHAAGGANSRIAAASRGSRLSTRRSSAMGRWRFKGTTCGLTNYSPLHEHVPVCMGHRVGAVAEG